MFFLVTSERFGDHLTPPGHPDRPARAHVMEAVAAEAATRGVEVIDPEPAALDDLLRVHAAEYVQWVGGSAGSARLEHDTFTSPDSADVARLVAGAAVGAVDRVLDASNGTGGAPTARAVVMSRPPGHHAERSRAMGFCIYNNVAIAAAHALARGLERVAIVDYDVHHGNGTQSLFYDDPRVLFVSTHQYPFYPGTGAAADAGSGAGEGFTVNVPLEAGATDGDYDVVFQRIVLPVLEEYRPQLVLASAGFDAHMRDPMARMRLSVNGLTNVAAMLRDASARLSAPAVFVTEGGYHLRALGACLDGLVRVLARDGLPGLKPRPTSPTHRPTSPSHREAGSSRGEAGSSQGEVVGRGFSPAERDGRDAVGRGFSPAERDDRDDPLTVEQAPLVEDAPADGTHRGPRAVELVRAAQKRYWPTL